MTEIALSPKERQALKARAHALDPVVLLGAQGLTAAVMREIDRALHAHELIKVRVPGDDREQRDGLFARMAGELAAARVQMIGKLLVLYRPRPEEPAAAAGARTDAAGRRHRAQPKLSKREAERAAGRSKPRSPSARRRR